MPQDFRQETLPVSSQIKGSRERGRWGGGEWVQGPCVSSMCTWPCPCAIWMSTISVDAGTLRLLREYGALCHRRSLPFALPWIACEKPLRVFLHCITSYIDSVPICSGYFWRSFHQGDSRAGFTAVDVLGHGTLGHITGVGIILGLKVRSSCVILQRADILFEHALQ